MAFDTPASDPTVVSRHAPATVRLHTAIADYDFLRATYEALLRASDADPAALEAAFGALEAAHGRLRAAHRVRVGAGASAVAMH